MNGDPHAGQPVVVAGRALESAEAAMILAHGRGASADGILTPVRELAHPGFAYLAPPATRTPTSPGRGWGRRPSPCKAWGRR